MQIFVFYYVRVALRFHEHIPLVFMQSQQEGDN